jgi:dihydroneopterin aldolase
MALIALEDVKFFAYHGFYEEEQIIGGEFVIDLYVETQIMRAARMDDLADTVNYETLYFICQSEMKKTRSLIETVAQSIVDRIETLFDSVRGVKIRLRKMNPPMGGRVGSAFVEIETGSFRKR